tara:strand:- start:86 stop:442 length:357 start_codon:yes stop_codon:yes gene_type:complete
MDNFMEFLGIIFLITAWLANSFYCGSIAASKGHDFMPWFFGGFFFGLLALFAVACLDDKELKQYIRKISEIDNQSKLKKLDVTQDYEEDEEDISEDERRIARSKLRALGIESFDEEKD